MFLVWSNVGGIEIKRTCSTEAPCQLPLFPFRAEGKRLQFLSLIVKGIEETVGGAMTILPWLRR